jgi:hypothetical protein
MSNGHFMWSRKSVLQNVMVHHMHSVLSSVQGGKILVDH